MGPLHPFRHCPSGRHWVREHPLTIPPSKKNPQGRMTTRSGHCADNPSHKDQLYPDEIHRIKESFFPGLGVGPTSSDLGFSNGNEYDEIIGGWTKYWNEMLQESDPLDPNLVKALIASESGFKEYADNRQSGGKRARGLMQVTTSTLQIMKDECGELDDFLIDINQNRITDPNLNICAGIRWLFHKKALREKQRGHGISWRDAVAEYKGYRRNPNGKGMGIFDGYYQKLHST